ALSHFLAGNPEPFTAVTLSSLAVDPEALPQTDDGNVAITFFDDVDVEAERPLFAAPGRATGAQVRSDTPGGFVLGAIADSLYHILRLPGVQAIELHLPATLANNRAGGITGVD